MPTKAYNRLIEALEDQIALIDLYLRDLRAQALRSPHDGELQRRINVEIQYQIRQMARIQRDRAAARAELAKLEGKKKE